MAKEFIIGSAASSAIPVPATARGVSGQHVKITVSDHGRWQLEDLDSANGTYIKDFNGDFQRVFNKVIDENTNIRLGPEGHSSYTFMAHRALGEGDDYAYEFKQLKKRLSEQEQLEAEVEARNARNMKVVKAASPIAMGLCIAAQYCIPGLKSDANLNLWISRGAMAIAPLAIGMFFGIDTKAVKQLKQRRVKVMTCPKCGYPISEFDIHNMQCTRCKAK